MNSKDEKCQRKGVWGRTRGQCALGRGSGMYKTLKAKRSGVLTAAEVRGLKCLNKEEALEKTPQGEPPDQQPPPSLHPSPKPDRTFRTQGLKAHRNRPDTKRLHRRC